MNMILSFDTEDFVTPESDDALLLLATELGKRGLRGNFALVGDKLRALIERGRRDVIEALRAHEIHYHSNDHHFFPLQAPLLEGLPWEEGLRWVMEHEAVGVDLIEQTFGIRPIAYIKADSHWTPQTLCAYRRLGIEVYSARHFLGGDPRPYRYMNLLCLPYMGMLDTFIAQDGTPRQLLATALSDIERKSEGYADGPVVYGTHPCMWSCTTFYDVFNVKRRGSPPAKAKWRPAPLLAPQRIDRNRKFLRLLLDELLTRGAQFMTYGQAAAEHRESVRWLDATVLEATSRQMLSGFAAAQSGALRLNAAEVLAALAYVVARHEAGQMPERAPLRHPLGPTQTPHSFQKPFPVCGRALQGAAAKADLYISETGHIPAGVDVGGHHFPPGPLLMALAEAYLRVREGKSLQCAPLRVMSDCPEEQRIVEGARIGAWALPKDYCPPRLLELGRLQSWTMKPL